MWGLQGWHAAGAISSCKPDLPYPSCDAGLSQPYLLWLLLRLLLYMNLSLLHGTLGSYTSHHVHLQCRPAAFSDSAQDGLPPQHLVGLHSMLYAWACEDLVTLEPAIKC